MSNPMKFQFWVWCILKATHTGHKQVIGNESIDLHPGEFIFGRDQAAKELGVTVQNVRTLLNFFCDKEKKITVKSTNKYSIVSVVKYNTWQQTNQQTNQQVTSNQPASNQQVTTNKKEEKEDNKPLPSEPFCKTESFETIFNWFWSEYASSKGKGRSGNKKLTYEKMARTISSIDQARIFAFAVKNYWAEVDKENEGRSADNLRALKLPEVFVNSWQGYIPEDVEARLEKWKKEKDSDRPPTTSAEP
jgi:hypothetical protein